MKQLQLLSIAGILALTIFSCSKSTDSPSGTPPTPSTPVTPVPTVNWTEELKNTLWAGEYRYTKEDLYPSLQPFSLLLGADGKVTWADLADERPAGNWKVDGSQINFTFPNGTTLSATLAKDKWTNFKSGVGAGFEIDNIASAVRPDPLALINSTWVGSSNGHVLFVSFTKNDSLSYSLDSDDQLSGKYIVSLAGMRLKKVNSYNATVSYYGIFQKKNTELRSIYHYLSYYKDVYTNWSAKR